MFEKLLTWVRGAKSAHRNDPTSVAVSKRYWDSFGATKSGGYLITAFRTAAIHSPAGVVALTEAYQELMASSGEPPRPASLDPELRVAIKNALTAVDDVQRAKIKWLLMYVDTNDEKLIRLPMEDSKTNYLNGFWQWVGLLAKDDYGGALDALYWSEKNPWTAETFKKRITTFFGGNDPWCVVIPNQRLINVINDGFKFEPRGKKEWGWFMGQIPLTTQPEDPKKDDIPLMGLAVSFYVRPYSHHYVMDFEIFHA